MARKLKNTELNRLTISQYKQKNKKSITVILDNVRSMNNVGSVFRTSDAFAIEKIMLCGITGTPPHRDIHKTAIGAEDSVDWEYFDSAASAINKLKSEGYQILGIEQTDQSNMLSDLQLKNNLKIGLIFGNEVDGISDEALELCDQFIEIPQEGTKHSLNISVAAGIVLWQLTR